MPLYLSKTVTYVDSETEAETDRPNISCLAMIVKPTLGEQQTGDTLLSKFHNKSKDLLYTREQQAAFATTGFKEMASL